MDVQSVLKDKGTSVHSILPSESIDACIKLMNEKRVGALMVLDSEGNAAGIISERDILRTANNEREGMFSLAVKEIMTPKQKLITAAEDDDIGEVMELMTTNRIRHMPIMRGPRVVGLISIGDVVKALLDETMADKKSMENYIYARY